MSDFVYSINVTIPIFIVMVLGYILRRTGMLNGDFVSVCNKFNFKVTLPVMLVRDIAAVDIRAVFDIKYVIFCALASTLCFWMIWGAAKLLLKQDSMRGAFVQASFRSSAAVMGLAFINNIYGESAMGPLMIIGAVPLYNIFSVIVLTFESEEGRNAPDSRARIKKACINVLKNPIIIAIFIGIIIGYLRIPIAPVLQKSMNTVAQMATPLALTAIGAGFDGKDAIVKIRPAFVAALTKLVLQPLIFIPVAVYMGFVGEKLIGILIMLAAPTTPSCYIMAKNMGNDGELTASIVVLTTVLASITLTAWIFILKSMGLIG